MATREKKRADQTAARPSAKKERSAKAPAADSFPVVAVGASAGGLEAFEQLLRALPDLTGMAIIYIPHLDPHHESLLDQILSRTAHGRVDTAADGLRVERGHVYVMPPNCEMSIERGVLKLAPRSEARPPLPIDHFFRSIAEDLSTRAIAVILSGSATDGSLGARAIKAEGGIVFAQDESAAHDGMPRAAISSGVVDFVLDPSSIGRELLRIAGEAFVRAQKEPDGSERDDDLATIFSLLQASHDIDFSKYKPTTIQRRVHRRVAVHRLHSTAEYLQFIRQNPGEIEDLYRDMLISVTEFFRDGEVFEHLKSEIIPSIIKSHTDDTPIRVWVPGCATGEEVYSLAITFLESLGTNPNNLQIQIFGTDLSEDAIEKARAGVYPENITGDISQERIRRFFTPIDGQFRISKQVRDICVFARQNLTKDPPFSKVDLISCRNVLIYLGSSLQRRVMAVFHYALKPTGVLLLGNAESIGSFGDLFEIIDRRHKIYRKKLTASRPLVDFAPALPLQRAERNKREEEVSSSSANLFREADRVLLTKFTPAGVLVNDAGEILQFRGKTSAFLEPAPGAASFDLLKMAREGLLAELRTAFYKAKKTDEAVRREGVRLTHDGSASLVSLEVVPFVGPTRERYYVVLFEEEAEPAQSGKSKKSSTARSAADPRNVVRLKKELEATREYLQSIIEEQEAMNEELRSANEEIQSSNEELQSTNEELETAKEELQSTNEELTTLNEELESRNFELAQLNNDLFNLLASIDIPILMLGIDLKIRRFNPVAQRVLNLIPGDVGRPINDMRTTLEIDDLGSLVMNTIDTLTVHETEVRDRAGQWYSMRIRPYKTTENKIDGAVITLVDISRKK